MPVVKSELGGRSLDPDSTGYDPYDFAKLRHIGPSVTEIDQMLEATGFTSLDRLVAAVLPLSLHEKYRNDPMDDQLGKPLTEHEVLARLQATARQNASMTSLIGMGYYGTITPPVIRRNVLENPAWYTAYTPYQSEISQGRLEMLMNFQTMICDLTGMEVANASLLDEATACAEAMTMSRRISRSRAKAFFIDRNCHPQNISVMQTRATPLEIPLIIGDITELNPGEVFGAIFQYPGTCGDVIDHTPYCEALRENRALSVFAADLLSLALLKEPGAMGADVCVGTTQRLGTPQGYGGPHAGYIATHKRHIRQLPGRIVGVSHDSNGRTAFRLALQTREQHIRRQKATSNICTAQVLPAIVAALYGVYHGPPGLRQIATRIHLQTARLHDGLTRGGYEVPQQDFFDTLTVNVGNRQDELLDSARSRAINLRKLGDTHIGISLDELTTSTLLETLGEIFSVDIETETRGAQCMVSDALQRTSPFMEHAVYNMNRSEAAITRYMRRLADRDLALDRTMIPLGSCTMKLNATAEMEPITWPEFTNIHPYVPDDQVSGYLEMLDDFSGRLQVVTGFDGFSLQPNSGAQGEFSGLMAVRKYHHSRNEGQRNICMVPNSAHGTNAASAVMAGMEVVEIASTPEGTIDLDSMQELAEKHADRLAVTMVTYPSTHGVFEEAITEVIRITHDHGGQVYMDGANFNAMLGLVKPGKLGVDVSHLNLHKTFCIPHGGGGPGMGPIGVRKHLVPFLPGNPLDEGPNGAVNASRFGSATVLAVSWAYVLLMAGTGLTQATKLAILNANYITKRLSERFEICYAGPNGMVGHECIVDIRQSVNGTGLTIEDVAKRIIDSGIHPPTMSFPVAGTLMIEPTESEPKEEIDRFIRCMFDIADDIEAIKNGDLPENDNPLVRSPHSLRDVLADWDRPYSRTKGCLPPGAQQDDKYWPPVNRVDNVYGDRNLICTWP